MPDKKAAKAAGPDAIMAPAEMKPILALSKRGTPISCAIALTKEKEGVILLHKKLKPKKLLAQLKKEAADAGLVLETTTLRFGRAEVDVDVDPGLLTLIVNKDAPGTMRPKLLEHVRKAGYKAVEITIDSGLEDEPEEDQSAAGQDVAAAAPGTPPPSLLPAGPGPQPTAARPPAPPPQSAGVPQQDAGSLTKALTDLVRRFAAIAPGNAQAAAELKPLAIKAQASLKSGDLAGAAASIATFRQQLEPRETGPAAPTPPPRTQAPAPSPALAKARLVWVATRQKVDSELGDLHAAFSSAFKGHAKQADLTKAFRTRVDSVLDTLDESLAHKLDAVNSAKDPTERAKLVQEAHVLIDGYSKHVASDATIAALDKNPFLPLAIQKTMTATLAALSKAIK